MSTRTFPNRKRPMNAEQIAVLRDGILKLIAIAPQTCYALSTLYGHNEKTMMNHLRIMRELGLIHATRKHTSPRTSYTWHLGPGGSDSVVMYARSAGKANCAEPKQHRKSSWSPVDIPKQTPWSALGL